MLVSHVVDALICLAMAEGGSLSLWERVAEGRVRVDKNALC